MNFEGERFEPRPCPMSSIKYWCPKPKRYVQKLNAVISNSFVTFYSQKLLFFPLVSSCKVCGFKSGLFNIYGFESSLGHLYVFWESFWEICMYLGLDVVLEAEFLGLKSKVLQFCPGKCF